MTSIGRYQIEREIGRGAMGVVYLARDPRLDRLVALKTYALPEGVTGEMASEFQERFLREARAAAGLSHPGIVTVYDAGEDAALGRPYIAMEYIRGQSLKDRLAKGVPLDPSWVVAIGGVLAEALHVAHRAGIVHRDIKPANILIREEDGAAKIADFGVARLRASELTQSGAALGSPGYMSPEQVRCRPMDGRSDLFSLAVVLYEALCGRRPFQGDDLASLAYSIAHDTQVPLRNRLPNCPAGLDRFFDRALSKNPEARFPDGAAFRQALLDAASATPGDPLERTVADAGTLPSVVAGLPAAGAAPGPTAASTLPLARPASRGRRRALLYGMVPLLVVGLAAAAYVRFGAPRILMAANRGVKGSSPAAAAAPHETTGVAPARPGRPVDRQPETRPTKPPAGAGAAPVEVEPVTRVPQIPRNVVLTVPAGTTIRLTLEAALGSGTSHAGDRFTARIAEPVVVGDRVAIAAGSRVHGAVRDATPARRGLSDKAGSLGLTFDRLVTLGGSDAPLSAAWSGAAAKSGGRNARTIGGAAAGGALLGRILGGKTKDAAVGTLVGGAIGTGIAAGTRGAEVELPAGSPLSITIDRPITLSVQP